MVLRELLNEIWLVTWALSDIGSTRCELLPTSNLRTNRRHMCITPFLHHQWLARHGAKSGHTQ
ncbi:unnamed protein product [Spirodela intermedia]|uniref:Uncharacterized protein n=1 Tax=Spirodela intermedia TaxID=51605 RepID=A0A7I8JSK2_SPIIN|nr:unnamed protein product [Spirodela intermedia]CAA6673177.1 unnamed protein product [Spirodela intermedia]